MGNSWLSVPRDWISSFGEIAKFCGRVLGDVYSLRVLRFFGEALRQCGILIVSSTLVIWGLVFIIGLQCGIEGAYFNRSVGAPAYAGVFAAWCDLRELVPYAFGYMMAAKVGTGIVAELGSMRISEEIDALEVMGIPSLPFLVTTRMIAAFIAVIPLYIVALCASYLSPRLITTMIYSQSAGTYDHYFLQFLPPIDILWSFVKLIVLAVAVILIHCYYGYTASGGPAGVGMAVGRAIRSSIVTVVVADFFLSFAIWGSTTTVRITG